MKKLLLAIVMALALVSSACVDVVLTSDFTSAKCNTAKTIVWMKNDCNEAINVSIKARDLEDFVLESEGVSYLASGESGYVDVYFKAADDFTGMREGELVINGIEKSISVFYEGCEAEIKRGYQTNSYSAVSYSEETPTDYNVVVRGWNSCAWIKPGINSLPVRLENVGATGDFEFEIDGDVDELQAILSRDTGVLRRGETGTVYLNVDAQGEADEYFLRLAIYHANELLTERDICLKVEGAYAAKIVAPDKILMKECEIKEVSYAVKNVGTKGDSYTIVDNFGTKTVATLEANQEKTITIDINGKTAPDYLEINATSPEVEGNAKIAIERQFCAEQSAPVETEKTVKEVSITVKNPTNETIDNVTMDITGVPKDWQVILPSAVSLGPNEEKELKAIVIPTTDEESNISVSARSGNEILATTGMFLASKNSFNWGYVVAIILIASAAVILLYMPKKGRRVNLEAIKQEVSKKSVPDEIKRMPSQKE